MGHHYVPQRYLQNFAIADSGRALIWAFDKNSTRVPRDLPIKSVAQSPGYYAATVEAQLNEYVEAPGGNAIDKLLRREALSATERLHLAMYLATMLKRVPHHRARSYSEWLPKAAENLRASVREGFTGLLENGADPVLVATGLAEADSLLDRYTHDPPADTIKQIRTPWPTREMVTALASMTWRVLSAPRNRYYITSDNPAVFHKCYGIGTPEAEIMLPLSPQIALHGCFQPAVDLLIFDKATDTVVREMNRRIAHGVTRWAFSHSNDPWVGSIIQKRNHRLNRLRFVVFRQR
jgi:hypothetical protein